MGLTRGERVRRRRAGMDGKRTGGRPARSVLAGASPIVHETTLDDYYAAAARYVRVPRSSSCAIAWRGRGRLSVGACGLLCARSRRADGARNGEKRPICGYPRPCMCSNRNHGTFPSAALLALRARRRPARPRPSLILLPDSDAPRLLSRCRDSGGGATDAAPGPRGGARADERGSNARRPAWDQPVPCRGPRDVICHQVPLDGSWDGSLGPGSILSRRSST
ncbi:hypothetical protein B0H10DRAFT_868872 [Mycena sp. CBHHK59/15]|nr:hypothetical protein B0H10DRAFT_868872 [Mycena sp. CBHHK59/15]